MAAGSDSVWVLDFATGRLLRIASAIGRILKRIRIRGEATDVSYGDGSAWVIAELRGKPGERLYRIDPATDMIVKTATAAAAWLVALTALVTWA